MKRLGDDARRLLAASGVSDSGPLGTIAAAWPAAVGAAIARAAWPRRLARDGTLHVATVSSSWAFELDRLAPEILERLGVALAGDVPSAVRFAPGPVPEPPQDADPEAHERAVEVTPEDAAEAARLTRQIEDPELRRLVARAISASRAGTRSGRRFC